MKTDYLSSWEKKEILQEIESLTGSMRLNIQRLAQLNFQERKEYNVLIEKDTLLHILEDFDLILKDSELG